MNTWDFQRGRGGGPCRTVAAASRDLSDVLPLQGCYERGLLHLVWVSKAKLEHKNTKGNNTGFRVLLMCAESKLGIFKVNKPKVVCYLSLTVTAPGVHVSSGGQSEHMLTAHRNVFDEEPLQRRHHLGAGSILQHGVRQADQALWRMNRSNN